MQSGNVLLLKEELLRAACKSRAIFLLVKHSGTLISSIEEYESEWAVAEAIARHKPSAEVRAISILGPTLIEISDPKTLLDENLLIFLMLVRLNEERIPEEALLHLRSAVPVRATSHPFFLLPESAAPIATKGGIPALLIIPKKCQKTFIKESVKLTEDAGYTITDFEIVPSVESKAHAVHNFAARLAGRLSEETVVIFAQDQTPRIYSLMEEETGCQVIGREELIISIFDRRADAQSGKLKVAASLINREKQVFKNRISGLSRLTGGIGLKGPGETKEEERRRILKNREKKVKAELRHEVERLDFQRRFRKKSRIPTVSIVGYTNAGKSTLFNALLNEKVVRESSEFFSSIDPKFRKTALFSHKLFLVDTVGFIEGMSQGTIDTFTPTLDEIKGSTLILHVIDPTDPQWETKKRYVETLFQKFGIDLDKTVLLFSRRAQTTAPLPGQNGLFYDAKVQSDIRSIKELIVEHITSIQSGEEL